MIAWDNSILVGIPTVDSDHKSILNHINQFIDTVESNASVIAVHDSFRELERRIHQHLAIEEQMLDAVGFTQSSGHKDVHANLIDELDEIWDNMLADPSFKPDEAAKKWLQTWLFSHVKTEDFVYRDWIFDAGLENKAEDEMNKPVIPKG